ncbi:MAG: hypothetical protein DWQ01_06060 [Planctomycetota bacterium]|nr:MAG: hypothetical protein DWQ01_06060 [Planctomycetota bacterium]
MPLTPPPDSTLADLQAAQAGCEEASDRFWRRCAAVLKPLARKRLGRGLRNKMETQDLVQDVLAEAIPSLQDRKFPTKQHFHSWLARLLENRIRKNARFFRRHRRDMSKERRLEEAPASPENRPRPLSLVARIDQFEHLESALENLSQGHRQVLEMRFFEELSFVEIGRRTGRSQEAARKMVVRALDQLTALLDLEDSQG